MGYKKFACRRLNLDLCPMKLWILDYSKGNKNILASNFNNLGLKNLLNFLKFSYYFETRTSDPVTRQWGLLKM